MYNIYINQVYLITLQSEFEFQHWCSRYKEQYPDCIAVDMVDNNVFLEYPMNRDTPDLFSNACHHDYVNVGFNSIQMACKKCGRDA